MCEDKTDTPVPGEVSRDAVSVRQSPAVLHCDRRVAGPNGNDAYLVTEEPYTETRSESMAGVRTLAICPNPGTAVQVMLGMALVSEMVPYVLGINPTGIQRMTEIVNQFEPRAANNQPTGEKSEAGTGE